jgi:hypothetical protein
MITKAAIVGKDGTIHTGWRHCVIIHECHVRGISLIGCIQGFTNENGEFLDRESSGKEAINCGQIKELRYNCTDLFSEEMWDKNGQPYPVETTSA